MKLTRRVAVAAFLALGTGLPFSGSSMAQELDKLRVGKSVTSSLAFSALQVGEAAGIWEKVGLDIEFFAFAGDAKMQQAFAAGELDVGLGSGPSMAYAAKGVPIKTVATLAGPPRNMALVVGAKSDLNAIDDLKGQRVGVTTAGSLTAWIVDELNRQKGWEGDDRLQPVAMGEMRTRLAAMESGELPASVTSTVQGYDLEDRGMARVLVDFGDLVPHFHTHVIFARDEVIEDRPEVIEKFLKGWFMTVQHMKDNKESSIKVSAAEMKVSEHIVAKVFDTEMGMMSVDGTFDPDAIDVLKKSYVELGILDYEPEISELYTDQFIPVKF
ncbi:ABC transporter substrate-binding protein [Aquibium sp. LZ166]|uniref:ABC transporter substrate-binding protein n=1 Tax=Aquibium pacificus TaxID=3153579 RepID=A0ABV3SG59_9HYPH